MADGAGGAMSRGPCEGLGIAGQGGNSPESDGDRPAAVPAQGLRLLLDPVWNSRHGAVPKPAKRWGEVGANLRDAAMILESLALLCTHLTPFPVLFPSPAGVPTSNSGRGLEMGEEMEETPSQPQAGGQEGGLPNQAVGARLPSQCFPTGDSSPPDKSASTQPQAPAPALGWWGECQTPGLAAGAHGGDGSRERTLRDVASLAGWGTAADRPATCLLAAGSACWWGGREGNEEEIPKLLSREKVTTEEKNA